MKKILRLCHWVICIVCLGFGGIYAPNAVAKDPFATDHFSISGRLAVTRISDGDSLRSGPLRIRLFGIDAPERKQHCTDAAGASWACGTAAKNALETLVASAPDLRCDLIDVDRYGRLIMRCFAGDTDLGAALVRAGLALAYRQYSPAYNADEDIAKRAKAGIWAGPFTAPWAWRRSQ